MGLFKKKIVKKTYDREHMKPVIRASICTGEEVAGFKDICVFVQCIQALMQNIVLVEHYQTARSRLY